MQRLAAIGLTLTLVGCASAPIQWAPASDFELAISDDPAQQRFALVLKSKASGPLCLSKESWPTEAGLPLGFDGAVLTTAGGPKELLPTGSAYCPGGCGQVRVEPGQELRGVITYAAFGDAAIIAADTSRMLTFPVHPYHCTR